MTLLCQHHCRVWTVNGGSWHYCVNITDVCGGGHCVAKEATIESTPLTCMDCEWKQLTLLCHHHWRVWWWSLWQQMPLWCQHHYCVWTVNWVSWHYCVNTTDVCGGGLCVATDATMVSTPLLCLNCEWKQLTLLCHHHWRVWWWTLWREMTLLCQHHCYIWTAVDTCSPSVSLLGLCYSIFCFLCSFLYIIVYPFVPFNLTIVMYVLLPITVSIYPFSICKTVLSSYHCTQYFCVSMRLLEYHALACSVYYLLNLFKM